MVTGPLNLAAATTSGFPDYFLQDIHAPLDIDPSLFFPPSCSTRPMRASLQGTSRCEPSPKERVGIFGEGCEIVELTPGFRRYSSLCQCFQEKVGESLNRSLSQFPPLTELSFHHRPTPPCLNCTPLINSFHLYKLPNSLFYICGFFRPVVANLLPL